MTNQIMAVDGPTIKQYDMVMEHEAFCDIDNPPIISYDEYIEIEKRINESATHNGQKSSMKFSDAEVKMTSLDLHNFLNFRCLLTAQAGFHRGAQAGVTAGLKAGVIISVLVGVVVGLITHLCF